MDKKPSGRLLIVVGFALGVVVLLGSIGQDHPASESVLLGRDQVVRDAGLQGPAPATGIPTTRVESLPDVAGPPPNGGAAAPNSKQLPEPVTYGHRYATYSEVQAEISSSCLALLPKSRQEYVSGKLRWKVGKKMTDRIPLSELVADDFRITVEAIECAEQVSLSFQESISQVASRTYDLFQFYADEFARVDVKRLRKTEKVDQRLAHPDPSKRSTYSCTTQVTAGQWKFPVQFYSADYPELQRSLDELASILDQRRAAVGACLGN